MERKNLYLLCFFLVLVILVFNIWFCFAQEQGASLTDNSDSTFVGVDKCRTCHIKEYMNFSRRKFKDAFNIYLRYRLCIEIY